MTCRICGHETKSTTQDYRYRESGLNNIILKDIEVRTCPKCKTQYPVIVNLDDLLTTIAGGLIAKPFPLNGPEIRFLRHYLGLDLQGFAKLLGADHTTISKWENNKRKPGPQSDRLIRVVAHGKDARLRDKIDSVVEHLKSIAAKPKAVTATVDQQR